MAACVGVHVGTDKLTGIIFSRYIDPSSKDVNAQSIASIVSVAWSAHMTYRGYQRTSLQGSTGWTRLHAYDAQKQSPAKSRGENSDIHCALLGQAGFTGCLYLQMRYAFYKSQHAGKINVPEKDTCIVTE